MKIKEIRELSSDELSNRKRELRQESFHLRLQQQSGQMEKPSRLRDIRREVARIETILSERANKRRRRASKPNFCHERYSFTETHPPPRRRPRAATTCLHTTARNLRKTRVGVVVSNKMAKTAVIETVTRVPHPSSARSSSIRRSSTRTTRRARRRSAISSASWKPAR